MNKQELKDKLWLESGSGNIIKNLNDNISWSEIVSRELKENPGVCILSNIGKREMVCADDRVEKTDTTVAFAGLLGLASLDELVIFIDKYKGFFNSVASHPDCDITKIRARKILSDKKLSNDFYVDEEIDMMNKAWAYVLSSKMGVNFRVNKNIRNHHSARAIMLDSSGKFLPHRIRGMMPHFFSQEAAFGFSREYCRQVAFKLVCIATGKKGFGLWFSAQSPLYILLVADNQERLSWNYRAVEHLPQEFGAKVKICGAVLQ